MVNDAATHAGSVGFARVRRTLTRLAVVAAIAAIVPRAWCGREASAWMRDDLATERALADVVAARAIRGVGPSDLHTGSALFDGEWALVTNQMTVLGLGQLVLAHPGERARYVPAIRAAIARLIEPASRSFGTDAWREDGLAHLDGDHGHVYLGYIALALGMARWVDPAMPAAQRALHDRLVEALARRLSAAPHALIETYPGVTFPADVASAIGAIGLHARVTGTDHRALLSAWSREFADHYVDPRSGFVDQTADPVSGTATGPPRGSGSALIVYFVSFADSALARRIDRSLATRGASSVLGFGGVRETPRDLDASSGDMDSGPVVFGISVSATGFGLAGAHMFGDRDRFTRLFRTAYLFGAPVTHGSERAYLAGAGLGDAILLAMMTAGSARAPDAAP